MEKKDSYNRFTPTFKSYRGLKSYLNVLFCKKDIIELRIHKKRDKDEWYAEYRDETCINPPFKKMMGII
jgi:hypothetical protein